MLDQLDKKPRDGGVAQVDAGSPYQVSVRSSMNLPHAITWDAQLRWIGRLPDPAVPAYSELDSRIGWDASRSLTVSLLGTNLLHARHVEYVVAPLAVEIARSAMLEVKLKF